LEGCRARVRKSKTIGYALRKKKRAPVVVVMRGRESNQETADNGTTRPHPIGVKVARSDFDY